MTIKTNLVTTTAGNAILNSTGSILQVVNANTIGLSGEITTTSASYVTTGLSVSITPTSATSKLYVELVGNCRIQGGSGDDGVAFKMYRDGVAINSNSGDYLFYRSDSLGQLQNAPLAISHYVNSNSTTTTTFTLFFCNQWGGTAIYNRTWGTHQFTVMEISA